MRICIKTFGKDFELCAVGHIAVLKRHSHPAGDIALSNHGEKRLNFIESGLRFNCQNVHAGIEQFVKTQLMEGVILLARKIVGARIFTAVGQISAVRPNGARREQIRRIPFRVLEQRIVFRFAHQFSAQANQAGGFGLFNAFAGKGRFSRLI